jgi:hypothetical protein
LRDGGLDKMVETGAAHGRSAAAQDYYYPEHSKPKLGWVAGFIDGVLASDREAPRKQHIASRMISPTRRSSWPNKERDSRTFCETTFQ